MSGRDEGHVRTLAFGDPAGRLWAAAVDAGAAALIAGDDAGHTREWPLAHGAWTAEGDAWRLAADGVELRVEPAGPAPEPAEAGNPARAGEVQELCRVHGRLTLEGREHRVDCVGGRAAIGGVDAGSLASVRAVSGWFGDAEAFVLLALRAARSPGQESDRVAAALFDPEGRVTVSDPRLSTTYDGEGVPTRVNLELWVGEGENEFPRRAAGEAAAAAGALTADGLRVRAVPLRCHSRGQDGAGVYVLAGR